MKTENKTGIKIMTRRNALRLFVAILGFGLLFQPVYAGSHSSTVKKLKAKIIAQQDKIDLLTMKLKNCQGTPSGEAMYHEQVQEQSLMESNSVPTRPAPKELFQWP